MGFRQIKPVINNDVQKLCYRPYPNHKKGCPNFGLKKGCPPAAKKFYTIIRPKLSIFIIWTVFNFAKHKKKMRRKHSRWSQRQLECCLYWQGTARKNLRNEVKRFQQKHNFDWTILYCPEACGVDVTATMAKLEEYLEWPPVNKTYQVAIAGIANS